MREHIVKLRETNPLLVDTLLTIVYEEIEKVELGAYLAGYPEEVQDLAASNMKNKILALLRSKEAKEEVTVELDFSDIEAKEPPGSYDSEAKLGKEN